MASLRTAVRTCSQLPRALFARLPWYPTLVAPLLYTHKQPCLCLCCEGVRLKAFSGPGLYKAIASPYVNGGSGTTTWTLDAFMWGRRIPAGEFVWVARDVRRDEKGGHLDAAVIWLLEDGADFSRETRLCTSKRWLEPA